MSTIRIPFDRQPLQYSVGIVRCDDGETWMDHGELFGREPQGFDLREEFRAPPGTVGVECIGGDWHWVVAFPAPAQKAEATR